MTPFADDRSATEIGDLKIENGRDRIACYGSLDLTHDRAGLALAQQMQAFLASVIEVLGADAALPDTIPPPKRPGRVKNPFGA
ncbi:MAG: hypothetical protein H7Z10_12490 [Gemmatimonadaceae bacterium]|nr:hypothetical protein [Acetobacteraceae bacterium]